MIFSEGSHDYFLLILDEATVGNVALDQDWVGLWWRGELEDGSKDKSKRRSKKEILKCKRKRKRLIGIMIQLRGWKKRERVDQEQNHHEL